MERYGKNNDRGKSRNRTCTAWEKVLLIDADPQGDLTTCLGWQNQDSLPITLAPVTEKVIRDEPVAADGGFLEGGVDGWRKAAR